MSEASKSSKTSPEVRPSKKALAYTRVSFMGLMQLPASEVFGEVKSTVDSNLKYTQERDFRLPGGIVKVISSTIISTPGDITMQFEFRVADVTAEKTGDEPKVHMLTTAPNPDQTVQSLSEFLGELKSINDAAFPAQMDQTGAKK